MNTDAQFQPVNETQVEVTEKTANMKRKKKKLTGAERLQLKLKKEREFKMMEMRVSGPASLRTSGDLCVRPKVELCELQNRYDDRLKREYKMSKKTARKYRERWEEMSREVKLKQMKQELEDWAKQVNRVVEQKDRKIELLLDEMATTEDFRRKSFSSNLQMMDYLTDTLKAFQEASYLLYEKEASGLLHDFYREVEERNNHENRFQMTCESVAHATEVLNEQELLSDYKIFLDKRDDRVNGEIEKRYRLRDKVLKKMKFLREQLLQFQDSLMNTSLDAQKYEKINSLMERQRNFQIESEKLNKAEERSNRVYADLQEELDREDREAKSRLNDLKVEHAYFMGLRKKIENEMKVNREETYERLKIVASESYEVKKKYHKLQKYGELLLSLAVNCRKFQTESEKVLPCGDFQEIQTDNSSDGEAFKLKVIDLKSHVDMSEDELQRNAKLMGNFWRRQALAEAQVVLLEEKKKQLLEENQNYIDKIKRLSKADNAEDLQETLSITPTKEIPISKFYS